MEDNFILGLWNPRVKRERDLQRDKKGIGGQWGKMFLLKMFKLKK
jgi:hypothetical protein